MRKRLWCGIWKGKSFPQVFTYVGNPLLAETIAPELVGAVDDFFQKFRDAGFKVGVTVSPAVFSSGHDTASDVFQVLDFRLTMCSLRPMPRSVSAGMPVSRQQLVCDVLPLDTDGKKESNDAGYGLSNMIDK